MPNSPTVTYAGQELFLVDGTLASLHHAASKTRLLDTLARRMRVPRPRSGDSGEAAAMHQALTQETIMVDVSEYETPVFIAQLDGSLSFGMFDNACALVEGDRVRAVVARSGAHLHVHSVLRDADQMMLLPTGADSGPLARVRSNKRSLWRHIRGIWIASALIMAVLMYANGGFRFGWEGFFFTLAMMVLSAGLIRLGEGSPYQIMPGGDEAQAIFTVYDFPLPEYFDASEGMTWFSGPEGAFCAPRADLALARHKKKFDR
ncbi:hypothetical protein [Massilia genomosp. 1]|uniref:Uncharacterized protein n=1 Tax=Massilia genomosp. 1 TaxID=2609280 RepID=A0ABX0MWC5_9BURK|nr:hypothetical protein [Massilia genomosp. 1]NHZ64368.1 hypothetical protein [Massilia genomosp. 1]